MACVEALKKDLQLLKELFHRDHSVFQVKSSSSLDEVTCMFIAPVEKFNIIGSIPDNYPKASPIWFEESENVTVCTILESLSSAKGRDMRVVPQIKNLLTSMCSIFDVPLPREVSQLNCDDSVEVIDLGVDEDEDDEIQELKVEEKKASRKEPAAASGANDDDDEDEMDFYEDDDDAFFFVDADDNKNSGNRVFSIGKKEQGDSPAAALSSADVKRLESIRKGQINKINKHGSSITATDRLMKELRDIYASDGRKKKHFEAELHNDNLYEWYVKLRCFDTDSRLHRDLNELKKKSGQDHVFLHLKFNDRFPFSPPFVRVVSPVIQGGYVMSGGAICMELLTDQGWSSAYSIEGVILQISATFVKGKASVNFNSRTQYSMQAAEESFRQLVKIHQKSGWFSPPMADG